MKSELEMEIFQGLALAGGDPLVQFSEVESTSWKESWEPIVMVSNPPNEDSRKDPKGQVSWNPPSSQKRDSSQQFKHLKCYSKLSLLAGKCSDDEY